MTHPIKVRFGEPHAGWLGVEIDAQSAQFSDAVSYTPNDFLLELTSGLSLAMDGMEATAVASCEPIVYEFAFTPSPEGGMLRFQLTKYPNWKRIQTEGVTVLSVQSNSNDVILPFWRALRSLEGRMAGADFRAAFQRDFPSSALDRLSQRIEAMGGRGP